MSNFASSKSVILKDVRLDFFDIFKPRALKAGGKERYKVKAIFEKDGEAHKAARAGMVEAAKNLWGDNYANVVKTIPANSRAVREGDMNLDTNGAIRENYKGMFFISASNATKPQVVGPRKIDGKFVNIHEDGSCDIGGRVCPPPYKITVPYRGCRVDLKVVFKAGKSFKAADGEQMPNQVYAVLEAVKFVRDDAAFGSGPTSAEGFEDEEPSADDDFDPMSGSGGSNTVDDDIPF